MRSMTDKTENEIMWFVDAPYRYEPEAVEVSGFHQGSSGQSYALFMLRAFRHFAAIGKRIFRSRKEAYLCSLKLISEEEDRLEACACTLRIVRAQLEKTLEKGAE